MYRHEVADHVNSVGRLSCHDLVSLLTLVGLILELGAVLRILWSVGIGTRTAQSVWSIALRVRAWLRRAWPWAKTPEPAYLDLAPASGISATGDLALTVGRDTRAASPKDLKEVGRRLNRVAEDLNRIDEKIDERESKVRADLQRQLEELRSEFEQRHSMLDEQFTERKRQDLSDRKSEGVLFVIGLAFQGTGALVQLAFC